MKKIISFVSAFALIALVTLTSCEKQAEGDALQVVGQWKISSIVVNGQSMTADEFKGYIDSLPMSDDDKKQAKQMADMNYTLNNNYKFSGFLPNTLGVFGNYSGDWSFDSASKSVLMVDKSAGLQWADFVLHSNGTMGKSVSATAMTITYIFKK